MWRGFKAAIGSWKTICMLRRRSVNCRPLRAAEISALEQDVARCRPLQEEYVPTRRRLAAAALADEPESLVGLQGEADPVDGMDRVMAAHDRPRPPDVVVDDQLVDLEQWRGGRVIRRPPLGKPPSSDLRLAHVRVPARNRVAGADFRLSEASRYGTGRWPARTGAQTGILR